tara:strand:- start:2283 stop:5198 length:2916 start_codon:yes stop_codon:yes gene_type:complete
MIRVLFLFTLFSFSICASAQKYSFVAYSTSEGLPQSQVNSITQDKNGYLWIATLGGLSKFDGKNFTNYAKSDGLLNNRIVHLSYINEKLYVGHDKGISYACSKDSFCVATYPSGISPANVTAILTFKGKIYVGTNGSGMFIFDPKQEELLPVTSSPERIRNIIVHNDQLVLATRNGIVKSTNNSHFERIKISEKTSFSSVLSHNGDLFATAYNGLMMRLNSKNRFDTIVDRIQDPFRSVFVDNRNRTWLNSRNGVVFKEKDRIVELSENNGLPINDINTIFQDREKNIWFGTGGKGIVRFTGEVFTHYNKGDLFPSDIIISMVKDSQKNYWFSTFDKGVFKVTNGNTESIDYIKSSVWSIDKIGSCVVFGSNLGLHVFAKGKWKSYYIEDGLSSNRIRGVKHYRDSTFIIGTSEGVNILNLENGIIQTLVSPDKKLQNVRDFAFIEDTIFLASQTGAYLLTDGELKLMHQFDASINCVELDSDKKLWIGTENGLFFEKNGQLQRKILENVERNDYVTFMDLIDGALFVGTNNGLFELDLSNDQKYHYDINSGLIDLETNLNSSYYIEEDSELWFGTASGLMRMNFDHRHSLFTKTPPQLKLTEIKVNFKPINASNPLEESNTSSNQLSIPYKNSNIEFEFDGIFLSNPNALRYQYYLEGFSEEWSPLMQNSDINFTNLPPGDFTLKFRVQNGLGMFSEEWTTNFRVLPPFYRTWWFYSLCVILIVILLFIIDRIRVIRLARKNYRMKLEFENKLSKLEQQSLNASMNRHFIFNSLNSIQYYINSSDKKSANKYLSRFAKLIRKNLDSSHRKDGMVALGDEIERLKLYLDLESMRFKDKFTYDIIIDPHVEIEMLKVPAMFLQPFVENSIIHGILPLKDRKGVIKINVADHMDHIRIEIEDNGVGIEHSVKKKSEKGDHESQGMLITKGRIELLQKISAKSIEMIGPHQINENDSSINGTIVIFKLVKQYLD